MRMGCLSPRQALACLLLLALSACSAAAADGAPAHPGASLVRHRRGVRTPKAVHQRKRHARDPPKSRRAAFPRTAGFAELVAAIEKANSNALQCKGVLGCLGSRSGLILNKDVFLEGALPPLEAGAYLRVVGRCIGPQGTRKCLVHGKHQWSAFSSPAASQAGRPLARLELRSLDFRAVRGGVIRNLWGVVEARGVHFVNNQNGVVSFDAGHLVPTQTYTNCLFAFNNGTAITAGDGAQGLALDQVAFYVRKTVFQGNRGYAAGVPGQENGGAVALKGLGVSVFEDVQFLDNEAFESGGAVLADQTQVKFIGCEFMRNRAALGHGAAFFGMSGAAQTLSASFCSCSFDANVGSRSPSPVLKVVDNGAPGFDQTAVTVSFCDTPVPANSSFPPIGSCTLSSGTGSDCFNKYC